MKLREIGSSGIRVHPIGMGCWAYGGGAYWGKQSQKDVQQIVDAALDNGVNLFDTAEMYNDGKSEAALGEALKHRRQEAIIMTKISPQFCRRGMVEKHCDASLKRLSTDYIDCYVVHWPFQLNSLKHMTKDSSLLTPIDSREAFDELNTLILKGKVRTLGVSNFGVKQLKEAFDCGAPICLNQITYNLLSRAIEAEILPFCREHNISIIGSMALQQGLLAGIYATPDQVPPAQAHSRHFSIERSGEYGRHHGPGAEKEIFDALKQIGQIAQELMVSMAQIAIAWVLAKKGIAATLVGSRNLQEFLMNLQAAELSLSDETIAQLDSITQKVLVKLGYNADYYEDKDNSRIF